MSMVRRVIYKLGRTIKATLSALMYYRVSFLEHYHGPDFMAAIQEYDQELESMIDHTDDEGSYFEAREKLWEVCKDRHLKIWEDF
jgi:hypothetical protein